jgi:hypothetical protein
MHVIEVIASQNFAFDRTIAQKNHLRPASNKFQQKQIEESVKDNLDRCN